MRGNSVPGEKPTKRSGRTSIGSLSEPAIRRQLLLDAVQNPATLLPLAVFIASGIYLLVLSPVLGGALWAVVLLIVCGIVAAASFVWRCIFRYTEEYAKRIQKLMDIEDRERARLEQTEMRQLRDALQGEFTIIGSVEGLKALTELVGEYEELQPGLELPRIYRKGDKIYDAWYTL